MEVNVVELVVQAGALGLTALLIFGLWKYGGSTVNRLLDNLDDQGRKSEETIRVQAEVAANLSKLCDKLDERQAGTADVLVNLCRRVEANEDRAQKRHQQMMQHADQRHAEMIGILKGLNGKP